jgi:RNA polymerase sigma factor (TIGR02999 family)
VQPSVEQASLPLTVLTGGTGACAAALLERVYDELRSLAGGYLRRQEQGHTLQPTALVHEAYLRVADRSGSSFESRAHFSALCAVAMRCILADHARRRQAAKRGGDRERVALTDLDVPKDRPPVDALALDEALTELARRDERQARVVEYRYFGGLTVPEVAEVLGVSRSTVEDDWRMARAWLRVHLRETDER